MLNSNGLLFDAFKIALQTFLYLNGAQDTYPTFSSIVYILLVYKPKW